MSEKPPEKLPLGERPPVRMVGSAPEEIKRHYQEVTRGRFGIDHFSQLSEDNLIGLAEASHPKEKYVLQFIEKSNEIVDNILRDFELPPFTVPDRNIHLVDGMFFEKNGGRRTWRALQNPVKQWILINNDKQADPSALASSILHEIIHLKGFRAEEVLPKKKSKDGYVSGGYRTGLMVAVTAKKSREGAGYFEMYLGLNEAVVEELTKRYHGDVVETGLHDPLIQEHVAFQKSQEADDIRKNISAEKGTLPDEIRSVLRNSEDGYAWYTHSYPEQREVLNYIVSSAADDGVVGSPELAMNMFFKAHFTGQIKELASMVDKTFGPGTYRLLKHMDDTAGSAHSILDDLMKRRRLLLAKRKKDATGKNQENDVE